MKLHKVEASSDDFIATAIFQYKVVRYDEHSYDDIWTEVRSTEVNFDVCIIFSINT